MVPKKTASDYLFEELKLVQGVARAYIKGRGYSFRATVPRAKTLCIA